MFFSFCLTYPFFNLLLAAVCHDLGSRSLTPSVPRFKSLCWHMCTHTAGCTHEQNTASLATSGVLLCANLSVEAAGGKKKIPLGITDFHITVALPEM